MREAICKFWPAAAGRGAERGGVGAEGRSARRGGALQRVCALARAPSRLPRSEKLSDGELTGELFETVAEEHLIQPTFIYDFPTDISPLSKQQAG